MYAINYCLSHTDVSIMTSNMKPMFSVVDSAPSMVAPI